MIYDFIIIGGGIVGLASALKIAERRPGAAILLIEKEQGLARHQSGHNSGVIHAGIYYPPGSFKAELCRRGAAATKAFCLEHDIAFEQCGKLIVATTPQECARMDELHARARANDVPLERLDAAELKRREPRVTGLAALFTPATGIVDYKGMCAAMGKILTGSGATLHLKAEVSAISEGPQGVEVVAGDTAWRGRKLVVCAGLQSDRLARLAGLKITHRIIPFRGEYFRLPPRFNDVVKSLIYPVPDPNLPFLGIHLTRMIDGSVTVGPNAVVGLAREGYAKSAVNLRDVLDYALFPGFWRILAAHPGATFTELRNSLFKAGYLEQCRKYCPELTADDLGPCEAGIRAQAVQSDGTLVHDFLFVETDRMLHVCNAPSPAATSALPIGEMIADKVL